MIYIFTWLMFTTILAFFLFIIAIKDVKKLVILNKYNNVLSLLDYFMKQAYDVMYRDGIFAYSASGTSAPQPEIETIQRTFIKLALNIMGPVNQKHFSYFFGGDVYLIENMALYFKGQLVKDELLKHVTNVQKTTVTA